MRRTQYLFKFDDDKIIVSAYRLKFVNDMLQSEVNAFVCIKCRFHDWNTHLKICVCE